MFYRDNTNYYGNNSLFCLIILKRYKTSTSSPQKQAVSGSDERVTK